MNPMRDHAHENLTELLRRFMDDSAAHAVQADLESVERAFEAHCAPAPSAVLLSAIKTRMVATAARRRRRIRIFRTAVATAAAIVLTALVARYDRGPAQRAPSVSFASIIPTSVWESHDLSADDPDLAYFTSEIHQIESQIQAIESGDDVGVRGSDTLDDLEMELMAIETEFWKG